VCPVEVDRRGAGRPGLGVLDPAEEDGVITGRDAPRHSAGEDRDGARHDVQAGGQDRSLV